MAEELNNIQEVEIEDSTKVLIGLRKKSDNSKLAIPSERYADYDKRSYAVDGIIIRNEDGEVDLLFSPSESQAIFGQGPEDIPETDKRRRNAPSSPSFNELDGYTRTQWQIENHHDTMGDGCAICQAVEFGWLPSNGEQTWLMKKKEIFNEVAAVCNADVLNGMMYWCSTQYDPEYMWCFNVESGNFEFWHSKATQMSIRPVKSASEYEEVVYE